MDKHSAPQSIAEISTHHNQNHGKDNCFCATPSNEESKYLRPAANVKKEKWDPCFSCHSDMLFSAATKVKVENMPIIIQSEKFTNDFSKTVYQGKNSLDVKQEPCCRSIDVIKLEECSHATYTLLKEEKQPDRFTLSKALSQTPSDLGDCNTEKRLQATKFTPKAQGLENGKRVPANKTMKKQRQKSGKDKHCEICGKVFVYKNYLKVHMRIHTGERPYHCDTCGKDFARSDFLAKHMKDHERARTGERPFECNQCGKKVTSRGFLQLHKERVHGYKQRESGERERRFSCSSCGKAFMTKQCLRSHEATHTDKRPHVCTLCGHSFLRKDSLTKHTRIHSGERPYSCSYCGKTFPYKHSLKSHMDLHTRSSR